MFTQQGEGMTIITNHYNTDRRRFGVLLLSEKKYIISCAQVTSDVASTHTCIRQRSFMYLSNGFHPGVGQWISDLATSLS